MALLNELVEIVRKLRSENGCPWDREQTPQTLTPHIIEEAYELVEAIRAKDPPEILEELGDVMLQVVMIAIMAEENHWFGLEQVIQGVCEKMIRRHPHVFSDTKVTSVEEVWENWESIKKQEKSSKTMASIPRSLPALIQAAKIQKRASRAGFDWSDHLGPFQKVEEEMGEIRQALSENSSEEKLEEEMGDLLFSMVNLARKLGLEPEDALKRSSQKFVDRFHHMEVMCQEEKKEFSELTLNEMNQLWEAAKKHFPRC